jgi:hypothetical protein
VYLIVIKHYTTTVESQPLGRNLWAATVASVDHAAARGKGFIAPFSVKPFLKRVVITPLLGVKVSLHHFRSSLF